MTKKTILRNYDELARYWWILNPGESFESQEAAEAALSRSVYKNTGCGAWAALFGKPVTKTVTQRWHLMIESGENGRLRLHSACMGGAWNSRENRDRWQLAEDAGIPLPLQEWLTEPRWDGTRVWDMPDCVTWDTLTSMVMKEENWPKGWRFAVHNSIVTCVLPVATQVGEKSGIRFGSIVEGVEQCTDIYDVMFPCTPEEIDAALDAVEIEAAAIWNETHGCPDCYNPEAKGRAESEEPEDLDEVLDESGDFDEWGCRPVDPNCPTCHGEGMVI